MDATRRQHENESSVGFTGIKQPFHHIAVFAEATRDGPTILEIASRGLGAGAANGQPDRGVRSLLRALVTAETEIIAEGRVYVTRMAGVDTYSLIRQAFSKGCA